MGTEERGAAYSSATCNCCAFILLLFACTSPYVLWGTYAVNIGGTYRTSSVGVGPFVAGTMETSIRYTHSPNVYYISSWLWWRDIPDFKPCSNPEKDIYTEWANKYGFCESSGSSSSQNGTKTYTEGSTVPATQAMVILATIFAFFATTTGFSASSVGSHMGATAAVMSSLAAIFAIASFSLWVSWSYSQALRSTEGAVIPVYGATYNDRWTKVSTNIYPAGPVTLSWGPGWASMLTSAIILTITSITYCGIARRLDPEERGEFGEGLMP